MVDLDSMPMISAGKCLDDHHTILIDISAFFSTRLEVEQLAGHLLEDIPPYGATFVRKYCPAEVVPEWRLVALDVLREWCRKTSAVEGARGGRLLKVLRRIGKEDAAATFQRDLLGDCQTPTQTDAMPAFKQKWLFNHEGIFIDLNIPVEQIISRLSAAVHIPMADQDHIERGTTLETRVHSLLTYLAEAGSWTLEPFQKVVQDICPLALQYANTVRDMRIELNSLYRSEEDDKQFTWLDASYSGAHEYQHLSAVSLEEADRMISAERSSSTAGEQERRDYVYSQPATHEIIELQSVFSEVEEIECKSHSSQIQNTVMHGEAHSASTAECQSRSCCLPPWRSSSMQHKRVGVYGGAGCGKTCCCVKVACQYANGQLWPFFRLVLFWRLRDPEIQRAENLEQLLCALGLSPSRCKEYAAVLEQSGGWGVLAVCDGIDELPKEDVFVSAILNGRVLPKACLLVTSRPCRAAKQIFRCSSYRQLELLGFREEQINMFIRQRLGGDLAEGLGDFLKKNASLASLMFVPLIAFLVCEVFRESPTTPPTTRTELYRRLVVLILRRAKGDGRLKSLSTADEDCLMDAEELSCLSGRPKALILQLAEVAYLASKENKMIFTRELLDRAGCSGAAIQIGFLNSQSSKIIDQFSFHHLTFQEFFVAYYFASKISTEADVRCAIDELGFTRHQHVVWQFFSGLIQEDLHVYFFCCLNDWLHSHYDCKSDRSRGLLRFCLQCAKEVCGNSASAFPSTLCLPASVVLQHVTAADLSQLAVAMQGSAQVRELALWFDSVVESRFEQKSVSRLKTQTRIAMTKLMSAIKSNKSLSQLFLSGPKYNLFEREGWTILVETVQNNSLESLSVCYCPLDDGSIKQLSSVLKQSPQLKWLDLSASDLSDISACTLAEDLKENTTMEMLDLRWNCYGQQSHELVMKLTHIALVHSA